MSTPLVDVEVLSPSSVGGGAEVGLRSIKSGPGGSISVIVIDTEGHSWSNAGAGVPLCLSDLRIGGAREPKFSRGRSSRGS